MREFRPINAFAICEAPGAQNTVRRIVLTDDAQGRIESLIETQADRFVSDQLTRVPFDPIYLTDDDSVLWISGYKLPDHVREAVENPREIPNFRSDENLRRVKSSFYVGSNGEVYFQCWRNFEVMTREKVWLILDGATFDLGPQDRLPLVIYHRLDAVFVDGDLFFRNFANASSMLDMLEYVADATSEDIEAFVGLPFFAGNAAELSSRCTKSHKRQIRVLMQSNVLGSLSFEGLVAKAKEQRYEIPQGNGRVVLPSGGKELTLLLGFLRDRVYKGPISGDYLFANSAYNRNV